MPRKNNPAAPAIKTSAVATERATCQQKRRFATQLSAKQAADDAMLQDMQLTVTIYRCPWCHGWHLTRQRDRA